ncbi:MAG: hypothetical protein HC840_32525 [Leptolyngbyaceae cyanobacterium RM2_2_4]|nr:hypothetical protein [Leptolyngbyaceae cyanobacterium RM2_2_4]
MITQKEAVVSLVKEKLGAQYNPAESCRDKLSKADLEDIRTKIAAGIRQGTIKIAKEYPTENGLRRYVMGMITNHLRKTRELNGGKKRSEIEVKKKSEDVVKSGSHSVDTSVLPDDLASELKD